MGEEATETKVEPIFLDQGDIIVWDKPVRKGYFSTRHFMMPNGITEILGNGEIVNFDLKINSEKGYTIVASATRYPALIARQDRENPLCLDVEKDLEAARKRAQKTNLFDGGIQIYSWGIPGTEHKGWYLERNGRIWLASDEASFGQVILGENKTDEERANKIERILEGYQVQDDNDRAAESRARHDAYRNGTLDEREHPGDWR